MVSQPKKFGAAGLDVVARQHFKEYVTCDSVMMVETADLCCQRHDAERAKSFCNLPKQPCPPWVSIDLEFQTMSDDTNTPDTSNTDEPRFDTAPDTSGRDVYNIVSDTVVGLNVRKSDNVFQAKFIGITVLVLATIGGASAALNTEWNLPWYGGALAGAFAGLVIGVFASGIFLMIYRVVEHVKGDHK